MITKQQVINELQKIPFINKKKLYEMDFIQLLDYALSVSDKFDEEINKMNMFLERKRIMDNKDQIIKYLLQYVNHIETKKPMPEWQMRYGRNGISSDDWYDMTPEYFAESLNCDNDSINYQYRQKPKEKTIYYLYYCIVKKADTFPFSISSLHLESKSDFLKIIENDGLIIVSEVFEFKYEY